MLSMFCCLFIYCNGETVCVWNLVWINFNHFKGWFLFMHSTTYRKRSFFTLLKKLFLCNLNFCLPQRLLQLNMTTGLCEISIPVLKIEKKKYLEKLHCWDIFWKFRQVNKNTEMSVVGSFQQITFCNVDKRTITKNSHHRCCNDWSWILQLRLFTANSCLISLFISQSLIHSTKKKSQTNKAIGDPILILVLWEMNCQQNAKGPAGRWSSWIFNAFPNVKHSHWWRYLIFAVEENAVINSLALQASQSNVNHLFEVIHLQNQKMF